MSSKPRDVVTLGADVGGKDAHAATAEHVLALRKLLQQECQGPYSETIDELALVLRLDGSVQSWEKSGVENVALRKRGRYATADIFVPKGAWSGRDSFELRSFLAAGVRGAVIRIGEQAQKKRITVQIDRLIDDVERAIQQFLA